MTVLIKNTQDIKGWWYPICDKHHRRIRKWQSVQAWGNLRAAEWMNLSSLPSLKLFISFPVSECNDSKNSTKITNSSGIFRSVISRSFSKNLIALFRPSKWHSCSLFQFFFFLRTELGILQIQLPAPFQYIFIQNPGLALLFKNKDTSL